MNAHPTQILCKPRFIRNRGKTLDQIDDTRQVIAKTASSALLAAGDPYVAALTQTTGALANGEAQVAELRRKLAEAVSTSRGLGNDFRKARLSFLGHVSALAKGDPIAIRSVGLLAIARSHAAVSPAALAVPLGLVAVASAQPGEVHLRWQKVKGARGYAIQVSRLATDGFVQSSVSPLRRAVLSGQPSAVPLYFRVATVGPRGPGAFSDAVVVVARLARGRPGVRPRSQGRGRPGWRRWRRARRGGRAW